MAEGRDGSARGQTSGYACGQDTRGKIEKSLREHDCHAACAGQKINACEECGIAGRARIRGKKLPVGVEAVDTVVQPLAGNLYVVASRAGVQGEMQTEKNAQGTS